MTKCFTLAPFLCFTIVMLSTLAPDRLRVEKRENILFLGFGIKRLKLFMLKIIWMISKIVLENWKTHKHSVLEFGKGTNVLVGVMGSGKTAITDAISFSLFGTFPGLLAKRVALDEVIMAKPETAEQAKLVLEFDYKQKNYSVERIVYRGKKVNEAKVYCEGRLVAGPKVNNANEKIEEILEVNYDLFSRAVYSEQNQIDFFLRLSPGERKQKFDELLEINKYETARANAVNVSNQLKRIAADKQAFLKEQRQRLSETSIKELEKRAEEKRQKQKELEKKAIETQKEETTLAEKIKALSEKEAQHKFLKELVSKGTGKTEAFEAELRQKKKELDCWKGKSIETELQELEKKEKELDSQNAESEKELKKARSEQAALSQAEGAVENRLKQIQKYLSELEKTKANCPVCRKPLEEHSKKQIMLEFEKETREAQEEKQKQQKEKDRLSDCIEALEKATKKNNQESEKLRENAIKLKNLLKDANAAEKMQKETDSLKEEIKKAEKALKELGFDERELAEFREQKANAAATMRALKSEIESSREIEKELLERIETAKRLEKQLEENAESIKHIEALNEKLFVFTNCLKSAQSELRETLIEAVNKAMADIWEHVYPYKDYSSAKIMVDEKGDYELAVLDRGGKWTRVEGILSGGERSAAAICIRIAFSLVLAQNLSWIILDEPTHNLDAQAVAVLSEMMRSHLPQLVEQIFVITHDKQMEKAASASLYLLERDKNNDGITKPTLLETN